jgi:hypothetical protein
VRGGEERKRDGCPKRKTTVMPVDLPGLSGTNCYYRLYIPETGNVYIYKLSI